jgi:hypothetical protein
MLGFNLFKITLSISLDTLNRVQNNRRVVILYYCFLHFLQATPAVKATAPIPNNVPKTIPLIAPGERLPPPSPFESVVAFTDAFVVTWGLVVELVVVELLVVLGE